MEKNEPLKLWQLIKDWAEAQANGWTVGLRGDKTPILENGEWKFYVGDNYVAGYPSCGQNLQAEDPEFLDKLGERLKHVFICDKCALILRIDRLEMEDMMRRSLKGDPWMSLETDFADTYRDTQILLNQCYRTMGKTLPYPTISINIDP